jgi:hypothetical protein
MTSTAMGRVSIIACMALLPVLMLFGCSSPKADLSRDIPDQPQAAMSPLSTSDSEIPAESAPAEETSPPGYVETPEEPDTSATLGTIAGAVSVDGRPKAFGTVQVLVNKHTVVKDAECDVLGRFRVGELRPGTYYLRYIDSRGVIMGDTVSCTVKAGETVQVDIHLPLAQ